MSRKCDSDSEDSSMFESPSSSQSDEPDKKRRRLNDVKTGSGEKKTNINDTLSTSIKKTSTSSSTVDPVLLEHAKKRLSKFAARLFDPNRIKGLVEAPATIPLNDEFLKAFGKREKEMDEMRGNQGEFDHTIDDDTEEAGENGINGKRNKTIEKPKTPQKKKTSTHKVKINNLAYRTSEETLFKACLQFGDLEEVNMVLDGPTKNINHHNSGRAYVTFETQEGAQSCLEGLKSLDGRQLRCSLATTRPQRKSTGTGRTNASLLNSQGKDISTICFRCGKVGHMESDCPNPPKLKPCCLCGKTDHDFRACPNKQVCFNCGQPGHVSRECTFRRGLPRRMVCGTCFRSGHHTLQCHMRGPSVDTSAAICMDCGRRGHFMCKELKWFYGLRGMSCFNCGSQGHSGYDCNRPTIYQCINNPDGVLKEIERAEADSIAEELERERRRQRESGKSRNGGSSRSRGNGGGKSRRAKSSGPGRRDRRGY